MLDVSELARGRPPEIVYALDPHPVFGDGHFHLVLGRGGAEQPLRPGPVGAFVRHDDGRVVTSYGTEAGVVVEVLGDDGAVVESTDGLPGYGLVTTPDHSIVGWLDGDGVPQVLEDGATRHVSLPAVEDGDHLGALLGSDTCQEQAPEGGGCTAFVDAAPDSRRPQAWLTTSHGIVESVPHLSDVRDASSDGTVVGRLTGTGADPRCFGAVSPRGTVRWRTCDHELTDLAPDGEHVIGVEGSMDDVRGLATYDSSGAVTATWSLPDDPPSQVGDIAWEGDESVLVVVSDQGRWSVVRLGLDGSAEYALAPIELGPDFSPYRMPLS